MQDDDDSLFHWFDSDYCTDASHAAHGLRQVDARQVVVVERRGLVVARALQARLRVGDFQADGHAGVVPAARLRQFVLRQIQARPGPPSPASSADCRLSSASRTSSSICSFRSLVRTFSARYCDADSSRRASRRPPSKIGTRTEIP